MKQSKNFIIVILLGLLTRYSTYYPQIVGVPLIKEKGDLRVDAGITYAPSIHGTVSYGLTDIAIQAYSNIDIFGRYHIQGGAFHNVGILSSCTSDYFHEFVPSSTHIAHSQIQDILRPLYRPSLSG